MGPGLYGDDDYDYGQNGYGYVNEGGTTDGGDMTLDMITDVDENEFDEDVSDFNITWVQLRQELTFLHSCKKLSKN